MGVIIAANFNRLLNGRGYNRDWIERQLAHTEPNSARRSYNHADYFQDRARMMQQWANLLDEWKRGDSNVVSLKEAAA